MKRILVAALAACLTAVAFGATTLPPSMINPAGSTAGQAILSTGSTGQPVWGAVPLTGITGTLAIANGGTGATTQAAALANLLGSSTVPIANGGTAATTAAAARTNLGLGTAATANTGTSGATVPLLSTTNTWTLAQAFMVRPTFNGATPWDNANLSSPATTGANTFTAAQAISTGSSTATQTLNASAGVAKQILAQTAGSPRWSWGVDSSSETGSAAGSNWFLSRYNDSGTFLDDIISITRSSGVVTFADGITSNGLVIPSSTVGIKGTTTNDSAQAGSIGEYNTVASTSTSITSATATNIASVSLAPGDYDVSGTICFNPNTTTVTTQVIAAISTTSATIPAAPDLSSINATFNTGAGACLSTPVTRESLSATTTVYLSGQAVFTTSTMTTLGRLRWRRVR